MTTKLLPKLTSICKSKTYRCDAGKTGKSLLRLPQTLAGAFLFLISVQASAFPGAIRKNYPSCVACHVNPTGGGVLTAYGREAGDQFLPAWYAEGESQSLYGLAAANETLLIGGDIRWANLQRRKDGKLSERAFLMIADVEPALKIGNFTLAAQAGRYAVGKDHVFQNRRAYGLYEFGDSGFRLKVGKFIPAYGLNIPNHTAGIRDALGLGQGQEKETAELSLIGKYGEAFLGAFQGEAAQGANLRIGWYATKNFHLGVNFLWRKEILDQYRFLGGLYSAWGITNHLWLLFECDYEARFDEFGYYEQSQGVNYLNIGLDVARGVQATITFQSSLNDKLQTEQRVSTGIGFIPRPHMELTFDYGLAKTGNKISTFALWMAHYWL